MRAQVLDSMDLERERGITIKAQAVRVQLPGARRRDLPAAPDRHARPRRLHLRGLALAGGLRGRRARRRRLAGGRGADARQHLPGRRGRARADPGAQQDRPARAPSPSASPTRSPTCSASPLDDILRISGKTGAGVDRGARADRRARSRRPRGDPDAPARALIFDSQFDQYRGVVAYVRVVDGVFRKGEAIRAMVGATQRRDRRDRLLLAADARRRRSCARARSAT